MKPYVGGRLAPYHAQERAFTPGGNCVGIVKAVGQDVWHLKPGRRVLMAGPLLLLKRWLSDRMFDRLIMSAFK
jgi:alcohol dehydrogenase